MTIIFITSGMLDMTTGLDETDEVSYRNGKLCLCFVMARYGFYIEKIELFDVEIIFQKI